MFLLCDEKVLWRESAVTDTSIRLICEYELLLYVYNLRDDFIQYKF